MGRPIAGRLFGVEGRRPAHAAAGDLGLPFARFQLADLQAIFSDGVNPNDWRTGHNCNGCSPTQDKFYQQKISPILPFWHHRKLAWASSFGISDICP